MRSRSLGNVRDETLINISEGIDQLITIDVPQRGVIRKLYRAAREKTNKSVGLKAPIHAAYILSFPTTIDEVMVVSLYKATAGSIFFGGKNVHKLHKIELKEFRNHAQIIFQNPYSSLNPRKSIREIIAVALQERGIDNLLEQDNVIIDLLSRVGLAKRDIVKYPHQFSGGQRQKISIARYLSMNPEFIVADEPVSALDVSIQAMPSLIEVSKDHKIACHQVRGI